MSGSWLMGLSGITLLLLVFGFRIPAEEQQLRDAFGESFAAYCRATGRFIPHIYPGR
jgi:protein-S-isoprenylcysteine O-methyltransferase Ste14